jgi:hypothetical protein
LTHPRNAGRLDLGCPFGCRLHNRRQLGNERSKKCYEKPEGRRNKKLLNAKRSQAATEAGNASPRVEASPSLLEQSTPQGCCDTPAASSPDAASVSEPVADEVLAPAAPTENLTLNLDGFLLDESTLVNSRILPYVRMVASVLERRTISREELLAALRTSMRQRSMARAPGREYVLRFLNQHAP